MATILSTIADALLSDTMDRILLIVASVGIALIVAISVHANLGV